MNINIECMKVSAITWSTLYKGNLAEKADQLILTQKPISIPCCLSAPKAKGYHPHIQMMMVEEMKTTEDNYRRRTSQEITRKPK